MQIDGWYYYNHAMLPNTPPHEEPNLTPLKNGDIWKSDNKVFLARYTTDFDCGYDTGFYYVIKEAPFDMEALDRHPRKHIRQALKKCTVKKAEPNDYLDAMYACYLSAHGNYKNSSAEDFDTFKRDYIAKAEDGEDFFLCFPIDSNELIGYMTAKEYDTHVDLHVAKFTPAKLNLGTSYALYHFVYDYYLNVRKKKYVSSGTKNINHVTNTQDYKEKTFACRKAYCKLNIEYNPKYKFPIKFLYTFRFILKPFTFIHLVHQLFAIFKMETIVRKQSKIKQTEEIENGSTK